MIANANRDRKKRRRPYRVEDFLFEWSRPPKEPQTWEDQLAIIEQLNAAMGGKDSREGRAEQ